MVKLSIIIPIYNVEQYIEKCINSVYKQGMLENEFEVVIVDDESPDNSLAIAKNHANKHTNITVISQSNKGLGGARNTGIKNAKGTYLLFLDSDDYILPNVLQGITNKALENNLDILEFGAQGVLPNGDISYEIAKSTTNVVYTGINYYNQLKYMNSACNKLYRRELLLTNNTCFLEKIYIEDFEFNTRAFFYAKKVMAINNIVAHYLQSPDSITRNTSEEKKEKMLNDLIKVLKLTKDFNEMCNPNNEKELNTYFKTRMSFINITIFYQLFKNKATYQKIKTIKTRLKKENLFCIKKSVSEKSKDLFRIIMLRNFWLFKIIQPLQSKESK